MNYANITLKALIVLAKLLFSAVYFYLSTLPLTAYFIEDLNIPFIIPLLISLSALVYVIWAIWSKGILKKIIMIIVMSLYFASGVCIFSDLAGLHSDYCIEDGVCEEHYIYNGRPINEEYCKELNGVWHINPKYTNYCKIMQN